MVNFKVKNIREKVKNDQFPRFIYKYMRIDKYSIVNLINNQFWCSNPKDFNDPFDCNFDIPSGLTIKDIDGNSNLFDFGILSGKTLKAYFPNFLDTFKKNPDKIDESINHFTKNALAKSGICCFSKSEDNLLLWSHYGDSHKGICLKFDLSEDKIFEDPTKEENSTISLVEYDKIDKNLNHKSINKVLTNIVFLKSVHWKYEEEIRLVTMKKGKLKFNPKILKEIIFGCKVDNQIIEDIMGMTKDRYPNIEYYKAKKVDRELKLEFDKL
jgi:hypothetical protein